MEITKQIVAVRTASTGELVEISANSSNMLGRVNCGDWMVVSRVKNGGVIGGRFGKYAVLGTEVDLAMAEVDRLRAIEIAELITPEYSASIAREELLSKLTRDMERADSCN